MRGDKALRTALLKKDALGRTKPSESLAPGYVLLLAKPSRSFVQCFQCSHNSKTRVLFRLIQLVIEIQHVYGTVHESLRVCTAR